MSGLSRTSHDATNALGFSLNYDVHTLTAAKMFGIGPADVTEQQRSDGRAFNLHVIYTLGGDRLTHAVQGSARFLFVSGGLYQTILLVQDDIIIAAAPLLTGWVGKSLDAFTDYAVERKWTIRAKP